MKHPQSTQLLLCSQSTNENGVVLIKGVPPGVYQIYVEAQGEESKKIEIEPNHFEIQVTSQQNSFEKNLEVNKFYITGRVVDLEGNGIPKVTILLDGEHKSISNENGFYEL